MIIILPSNGIVERNREAQINGADTTRAKSHQRRRRQQQQQKQEEQQKT
jgi:hypothetical protein